ncbi:type-4 fimbrial pilin related signal peptide protein [mine drainage metagenome]|uniref:Type-4 fimbrial pilin related signal peptide protein n=1 Tax=mine drainage metagenome TaxID=410659 RepID=T1CEN1_9ZZZZ
MKQQMTGLTLLELIVVIALAAILVTIAVPNYTEFMTENRMASEMNGFVTSLMLARSEAIKRGQEVTLCASSNGTDCSDGAWSQGWLIFRNSQNASQVPASSDIIRVHSGFSSADTLTGSAPFDSSQSVSFTPLGILISAELTGGTFTLEDSPVQSFLTRCLTLGPGGQPTASEPGATCPAS